MIAKVKLGRGQEVKLLRRESAGSGSPSSLLEVICAAFGLNAVPAWKPIDERRNGE